LAPFNESESMGTLDISLRAERAGEQSRTVLISLRRVRCAVYQTAAFDGYERWDEKGRGQTVQAITSTTEWDALHLLPRHQKWGKKEA